MAKRFNNIHKLRNVALCFIIFGLMNMYAGIFFKQSFVLMTLFFLFGLLSIIAGATIYFFAGMLSAKASRVICPVCQKTTKILGKTDVCMYCRNPLTAEQPAGQKSPKI